MSAEAQAAFDGLRGFFAFLENAPSERKIWVWDGLIGGYYSQEGVCKGSSKLSLIEFSDRLDYRSCPVPSWFSGHEFHEDH